MIGRKVASKWHGLSEGTIERWEPLGAAMCDVLVRDAAGHLCWYASTDLTPIDGLGPLPSRREEQARAKSVQLASLKRIREQHVQAFHRERWPGTEFGKAILGRALDAAIEDLSDK